MTACAEDEAPQTARTVIVGDPYRIVELSGTPADLGEKPPATWGEVVDQVRRHLLRIAAAPTRLLAEIFEGATRLVKGVTRVPLSLATRIENAHATSDTQEDIKQERIDNSLKSDEALENLIKVMDRLRSKGLFVEIIVTQEGQPLIVALREEQKEIAGSIISGFLKS